MIIQAVDIHKSFGELEVLKGVSFSAEKSEIVAIVGASGAGKSTLLQILGTLSTPDQGALTIDGRVVFDFNGTTAGGAKSLDKDALARFRCNNVGFVFQAHHLLPEFSALENVMMPQLIAGKTKREARVRAAELLSTVGLEGRVDHKPSELSGGEQQRVAIARALANNPAVLFADEPTGNLDSATKQEIHKLFFDLRDRFGHTIILVTHDQDLAGLCDRSLQMKDGLFV